jgi:hypothetical protein
MVGASGLLVASMASRRIATGSPLFGPLLLYSIRHVPNEVPNRFRCQDVPEGVPTCL